MDLVQAILLRERRARSRAWDTGVAQGPAAGDFVPVNCSGTIEQVWCSPTITPAAGDVVALVRGGTPMVVGILALGDQNNPDLGPVEPVEAAEAGVSRFPALYSWTWEDTDPSSIGRFRYLSDVYQGDSWPAPLSVRKGWWFYSQTTVYGFTSPISAALAGATVDAVRMRMASLTSGSTSTISLTFADGFSQWPPQAGDTGPYGAVPASPSVGTAPSGITAAFGPWVNLPTVVGQRMVDATVSPWNPPLAIGLTGSANLSVAGIDTDPQSGLLEIAWHR